MDLKNSIKEIWQHGSIYLIGLIVNTILRLALLPVYTRFLSTTEYGILALLDTGIEFIRIATAMGVDYSIVRLFHEKEDLKYKQRVMGTGLSFLFLLLIASCIILFPFSRMLTEIILGKSGNIIFFQLALGTMLVGLMRGGVDSYLTTKKRSVFYGLINTGQLFFNATLNICLLVFWNLGVMAMLIGNFVTAITMNIALVLYVVKSNGIFFDKDIIKKMIRLGLPLVPAIAAIAAVHNIDRFFIRVYAGLGEVGLYNLAYQLPFMLNALFIIALEKIWSANTIYKIAETKDASFTIGRICTYYMTILTVLMFSLAVSSDVIIYVLADPKFYAAHQYLPIITLGIWGYSLHTFIKVGVDITKKTYLFPINHISALILNVIMNFILVPKYGAKGAAWATVFTYFSFSLGGFIVYRHCFEIKFEWLRLSKLLGLGILIFLLKNSLQINGIFMKICIEGLFIILFPFILITFTGFMTKGEKSYLGSWLQNHGLRKSR